MKSNKSECLTIVIRLILLFFLLSKSVTIHKGYCARSNNKGLSVLIDRLYITIDRVSSTGDVVDHALSNRTVNILDIADNGVTCADMIAYLLGRTDAVRLENHYLCICSTNVTRENDRSCDFRSLVRSIRDRRNVVLFFFDYRRIGLFVALFALIVLVAFSIVVVTIIHAINACNCVYDSFPKFRHN